jgi:polyhydroxybutyrate depolymerase
MHPKLPLVLALHGGGGTAADFIWLTHFNRTADSAGFIVVYPDGLKNPSGLRTWNAGKCCAANAFFKTDDVGFISALIDTMVTKYQVDSKRVYATGHSNGAMLCYRLANELSEKIAAIAPNSGTFEFYGDYNPKRNVPAIHIHSKKDSNIKYNGGISDKIAGIYAPPVDDCLKTIAQKAGCKTIKKIVAIYPLYTIYQYTNCNAPDFEVLLYLTNDGGHSWPGGKTRLMADHDPPSQAFDNNVIIWNFFKRFSLP